MEIIVAREHFNDVCSIGSLRIEGDDVLLYTLEDKDRKLSITDDLLTISKIKVFGKTAIPYGRYEVLMTYSNRFRQTMPLLLGVPGFEGVRIHSGNTAEDTEGCILVGYVKDVLNSRVMNSRTAISELYMLITEKIKAEKVYITITKLEQSA